MNLAAADAFCVAQSAISHRIRHVEDGLGKPLFAREGNRTRLLKARGAEPARSLTIALARQVRVFRDRAMAERENPPAAAAAAAGQGGR